MFISKSMTQKVVTINEQADIIEAREKMDRYHIRHLPVIGANGILVGIVTDRDIRSALPSAHLADEPEKAQLKRFKKLKIKDIMTQNPLTVSASDTIQDALLMIQNNKIGALPVVDDDGRLTGILSVRDLLRAFINVLGIGEPGTLVGILVEEKIGQMKKIVDAITEEKVSFGSILVARHWDKDKRAVFPYLLTQNIGPVKRKLEKMGYTLLDPLEWYLDQIP